MVRLEPKERQCVVVKPKTISIQDTGQRLKGSDVELDPKSHVITTVTAARIVLGQFSWKIKRPHRHGKRPSAATNRGLRDETSQLELPQLPYSKKAPGSWAAPSELHCKLGAIATTS
jgi:hypothetical protein